MLGEEGKMVARNKKESVRRKNGEKVLREVAILSRNIHLHFIDNIDREPKLERRILYDLPRNGEYDLYIRYLGDRGPVRASGLNYIGLAKKIVENLAFPLNEAMRIIVMPQKKRGAY